MWSFVHDKSQQYWLRWAIDHQTGVPPAYCFGTREHRNLDELRTLPDPFHIKTVYADGNYAYQSRITESTVVTGKKNTQRMERKHLSLRTWCSRLVRKSLRFSKLHLMHHIVVGLVINCRLFGRVLPFHLIYDIAVHFGEDFCRIEDKAVQQNLTILRKFALSIIKTFKQRTSSKRPFPTLCSTAPSTPIPLPHFGSKIDSRGVNSKFPFTHPCCT